MKNSYLLLIIFSLLGAACANSKVFKTDVSTEKKPWTNLNFNNNPDNFQFAIVSDKNGGSRPGVFEDAVRKINLMQPEFVLSVGDLIAGYTTDTAVISKQWKEINGVLSELKMPFFYLPGNHDITNKVMEKEWEKRYGSRYYSFNYKNTLFIILDSNDDDDFNLTRLQTDFVLKTLKDNSQVRWTFVLMHHPIWTYNTDGRFEEIEAAMKDRKFTVIAGHEHHYHQAERNGANYYILSTTGAGSALRGNYFGEFDHVSWVTMTDQGPVMANLRLDGILPHDISNEKTEELAKPLIDNATLNNVLLCNKGNQFTNATLYLAFKNPTKSRLNISINFFHHHQLQIKNPMIQIVAEPGSQQFIEVPLSSAKPLDYSDIDLLLFEWELSYDNPEYKGFALHGKYQIEVKPTQTQYIDNEINAFIDHTTIPFFHQFSNLETFVSFNNLTYQKYNKPLDINNSCNLSFYLKNNKNEFTVPESRTFEKTTYLEPIEVSSPQEGLKYKYYEGIWTEIPDFGKLEAKISGVAKDFIVTDLAKRPDNWGIAYNGYVKVDVDNFYLFRIKADDACRMYIGDKLVVDDKILIKGENMGAVALKKGFHPVRIEYLEKEGDAKLRLYMKVPGEEDWNSMEPGPFYH